ncbi:small heat shock protein [Dichomitus squalens]|uniref:Small heat shock protein n=1 Tax=Dichomitus squalens TaxID=114155 RepID=A0A4Q9MET6_9APHY|nr:small heat shock protein [Dichomitus squalens]
MSLFNFFNNDPFSEFDRLFDEAFARRTNGTGANQGQAVQRQQDSQNQAPPVLRPRVDIHEDKEKNLVTATFELPGINKQDVSIDVHNNRLTISGESRFENEDRKENGYVLRERRFGRFSRSLPVPQGIKPEDIKASMANGVLTVTFPRQTAEQLPKRITIS